MTRAALLALLVAVGCASNPGDPRPPGQVERDRSVYRDPQAREKYCAAHDRWWKHWLTWNGRGLIGLRWCREPATPAEPPAPTSAGTP